MPADLEGLVLNLEGFAREGSEAVSEELKNEQHCPVEHFFGYIILQ